MTNEEDQAWAEAEQLDSTWKKHRQDAEYLGGLDWSTLSPRVLRWIASRVALVLNDESTLRDLGLFDPYNPGKTGTLPRPILVGDVLKVQVGPDGAVRCMVKGSYTPAKGPRVFILETAGGGLIERDEQHLRDYATRVD